MSTERHGRPPPQSKPQPSSGISPPTLPQLTQRLEALEKLVKEHFDEKNNWNSEVRGWVGKPVHIQLVDGSVTFGTLRWMDRYTICIDQSTLGSVIVHKGAIALLRLRSSSDSY